MTVIINSPFASPRGYIQNLKSSEAAKEVEPDQKDTVIAPAEDKIILSERAKEVYRFTKMSESLPDVREDKISAIKSRIASGEYKVDSKKVAGKIISESILNEFA